MDQRRSKAPHTLIILSIAAAFVLVISVQAGLAKPDFRTLPDYNDAATTGKTYDFLVFLVHGFNSNGTRIAPIQGFVPGKALTVIMEWDDKYTSKDYRETPVDHAAKALIARVRQGPERSEANGAQIVLIGHSTGGLICNAAAQELKNDVHAVIYIATPHGGVPAADFVNDNIDGRGKYQAAFSFWQERRHDVNRFLHDGLPGPAFRAIEHILFPVRKDLITPGRSGVMSVPTLNIYGQRQRGEYSQWQDNIVGQTSKIYKSRKKGEYFLYGARTLNYGYMFMDKTGEFTLAEMLGEAIWEGDGLVPWQSGSAVQVRGATLENRKVDVTRIGEVSAYGYGWYAHSWLITCKETENLVRSFLWGRLGERQAGSPANRFIEPIVLGRNDPRPIQIVLNDSRADLAANKRKEEAPTSFGGGGSQPQPMTPAPAPATPSESVALGQGVYVDHYATVAHLNRGQRTVNVRSDPSLSGRRLGGLGLGTEIVIIGGPVDRDGWQWIKIRGGGLEGWSVLGAYDIGESVEARRQREEEERRRREDEAQRQREAEARRQAEEHRRRMEVTLGSTERRQMIDALYRQILERPADQGGLDHYDRTGMNRDEIAESLRTSVEGASMPASWDVRKAFYDAWQRNGGNATVGTPDGQAHQWPPGSNRWILDMKSPNPQYKSALMKLEPGGWQGNGPQPDKAYWVHGGIGNKYFATGGAPDKFGFPLSDEYSSGGWTRQDFQKGYILHRPGSGIYDFHFHGGGVMKLGD